ncbi:MAG: tetratricopeptide repeat protein [Deltaproteobacteria bacterium]|nr:tetratricopeptide repeat protein [Deltaproteobacteria bacterium]
MTDWLADLERALNLHMQGHSAEAVAIGQSLLGRARGTAHAASVHRHMAEFLHACGDYDKARDMAREAGVLARATRHAGEILAASLMELTCDLFEGQVAVVHQQLGDLIELAPGQPTPLAFMATLALTVGNFEQVFDYCELARNLVEQHADPDDHPELGLFLANLLMLRTKALLLDDKPGEAATTLEPIFKMVHDQPLPLALASGLKGLAWARSRKGDAGMELAEQAVKAGRKIGHDLHGHCLCLSGACRIELEDEQLATEELQSACGLLVHALDRQEPQLMLGRIYKKIGRQTDAVEAFHQATQPSIDTFFGRQAVQSLHDLEGLRSL